MNGKCSNHSIFIYFSIGAVVVRSYRLGYYIVIVIVNSQVEKKQLRNDQIKYTLFTVFRLLLGFNILGAEVSIVLNIAYLSVGSITFTE
jgi:hypothetical protein